MVFDQEGRGHAVRDLAARRSRLTAAGVQLIEGVPIPGSDRVEFRAPFGDRVELIEAVPGDSA
jgi:hypothetical protein